MAHNLTNSLRKDERDSVSKFLDTIKVRVITADKVGREPGGYYEEVILSHFQFMHLTRGSVSVEISGEQVRYDSGDTFFCFPFQVYAAKAVGTEPVECYYVAFDIDPYVERRKLMKLLQECGQELYRTREFMAVCEKMLFEIEHKSSSSGFLKSIETLLMEQAILIIRDWIRQKKELVGTDYPKETMYVSRVIELVEQQLEVPVSVERLAGELHISVNSLYKAFVKVTGISPSKYLTQYKMLLANERLHDTDTSLELLAAEFGYSSAFHFSNTYKKVYGYSPKRK